MLIKLYIKRHVIDGHAIQFKKKLIRIFVSFSSTVLTINNVLKNAVDILDYGSIILITYKINKTENREKKTYFFTRNFCKITQSNKIIALLPSKFVSLAYLKPIHLLNSFI
jgi:hypothetical protein